MDEPPPIDHKDEPGEYRRAVREHVIRRAGGSGRPVADRSELVGEWVGSALSTGKAIFAYGFRDDGTATFGSADGSWPAAEGEWRLNADGALSLLEPCAYDAEFGIEDSQLVEERRHLAALDDGRFVMWNGDGSLVIVLSRRSS